MTCETIVEVLASMSTAELEGARARLAMSGDPAAPVAMRAVDSELLRRDVSFYPRERYLKAKIFSIPPRCLGKDAR